MFPRAQRQIWGGTATMQNRLKTAARPRRRLGMAPAPERLEDRRLLSFYTGPSAVRNILASGGIFQIQVEGQGLIKVHPGGNGAIDLSAFGTNPGTTLNITQIRPRYHFPSRLLSIHKLTVTSNQLGGLNASAAELTGTLTPLTNTMTTFALGELGPAARVEIIGSVGEMTVSNINLGPTGLVSITGGINTAGNPTGTTTPGDLTGLMTIGNLNLDGGRFEIGQDSVAPIAVLDNMTISHDGLFSIGRDMDGPITVNGNLELSSGGQLFVGRNLDDLTVNGNVIVNPSGSGIVVNGTLDDMVVVGTFEGQGGTATPTFFDLGVGLTIDGLSILGGNISQNGLINANIRAGGSISGVDVVFGSVNSTIQPNTPPPAPV